MTPGDWISNNGCGMTVGHCLNNYCGVGNTCPFIKRTYNYNNIHCH